MWDRQTLLRHISDVWVLYLVLWKVSWKHLYGKEFHKQISETVKVHNSRKSCWQVLFLKTLQVETILFARVPPNKQHRRGQSPEKNNNKQKNWNSSRNKKHNGKYANENNPFQGDTNSDSTIKVTIYTKIVCAREIILGILQQ